MATGAFTLRPMPVAAEVVGLAPGCESDPEVRAELYDAWLQHGVLVFRGVESNEHHLALSRCFGELEMHPIAEARSDEDPAFLELGGATRTPPAYVYDETELRVNRIVWHRDTAYTPYICKGAMLRLTEIPSRFGQTLFSDTAQAYDGLPGEVKARLDGLEYKASLRLGQESQTRPGALWTTVREATLEEDPASATRLRYDYGPSLAKYPSVVHPAVLVHPESGRKCIFLSPTYVDGFLGMEEGESDELLRYLVAHMSQPRYVYEHEWMPGDALLWDNRRMMHAAVGNLPNETRRGLRTTLASQFRPGRYFDPDAVPTDPLLVD